ncbi:MAG: hypothetical protein WA794_05890, partial [Trebonia sp.]
SLASVPFRETQRSLRAGQAVEPGQDARYRLIDMGQHAFVVVTWEGRVLEPVTVQPGGEQPHAASPGDLLVFLAPEREQRAWQIVDQEVRWQFRQLSVERERGAVVET